jgi:hypothetical protein
MICVNLEEGGSQLSLITKLNLGPKANDPNIIAYFKQTPIIDWCIVRCGSKN